MDAPKAAGVLAVLLAFSLAVNVFLLGIYIPALEGAISQSADSMDTLSRENLQLQVELDRQNATLQRYASLLTLNPARPAGSGTTPVSAPLVTGFASLQAPVVTQQVVEQNTRGFILQTLVTNGSMTDVAVEIRPGQGRVLVQTTPLMGIVFQDAANTAVAVARDRTGANLSASDVIFSITAEHEVTAVDGPSAGALMTLITIAAIEDRAVDPSVTLTGTVDESGHVGAIGGVVEKAKAAKAGGKTTLILPAENRESVQYTDQSFNYGGFTFIRRVPQRVSTVDALKDIGITIVFADTIDDILSIALK